MMLATQRITQQRVLHPAPRAGCTLCHRRVLVRRFAEKEQSTDNGRTMSSLDSLLGSGSSIDGSLDEDSTPVSSSSASKSSASRSRNVLLELSQWRNGRAFLPALSTRSAHEEEDAPKVKPISSYFLYYLHIMVFSSQFLSDAYEGPGTGDDLRDLLMLDHLSVTAGGEWWRLLTAPFVHSSPTALFITLITMLTLSAEAEAVLGYWSFGITFLLSIVTAGLVDIAINDLPVTHGALPSIAALVGVLVVHQLKNSTFDDLVDAARAQRPISAFGTTAHMTTTSVSDLSPPSSSHGGSGSGSGGSHMSGGGAHVQEHERVAHVDFLEGMYKIGFNVGAGTRSLAGAATALVACAEAFYDLRADDQVAISWAGIAGGFAGGVLLALALAPVYSVTRELLSEKEVSGRGALSFRLPEFLQTPTKQATVTTSSSNGAPGGAQLVDVLVVRDVAPLPVKFMFTTTFGALLWAGYNWLVYEQHLL